MSKEAHGNGYRGGAATHRQMRSRSVGFAYHRATSLKPVHDMIHSRQSVRSGNGWAGIHANYR
jgi:hypothetical protein